MNDKSILDRTQQKKSKLCPRDSKLGANSADNVGTSYASTKPSLDLITSIHHRTIKIRKTHQRGADGSTESINYQNPKTFSACVEHRIETFEDMVAALVAEENSPKSGIVRARYNTEDLGSARLARRFYRRFEHGGIFHTGPRMHRWQVFDVDELCIPPEMEGDYDAILQYTIDQLPEELRGCDFFYQWSGSMGVKPGVVKIHLYTLLDRFVDDSHIQKWISHHNEQYRLTHADRLTDPKEDLIDCALWRPVQLLTTSPPEFIGMHDPLKSAGVERSGVVRGTKGSVDLVPVLEEMRARLKAIKDQEDRDRKAKQSTVYVDAVTPQRIQRWAESVRNSTLEKLSNLEWGSRTDSICTAAKTIGGLVGGGYLDHNYELDCLIDVAKAINPKKARNSASQAKSYFKRGIKDPLEYTPQAVQSFAPPKKTPKPQVEQEPKRVFAPAPTQANTLVEADANEPETAEEVIEELDLVDVFQRNYDDAKRVLNSLGRFTLANQCGTGKNTAIINVLVDHPELLDGLLIAEPTCVKRDEMAREMRATGLPVREAVTRTSKNCRRLDDLIFAGQKSPEGASQLCLACEFNPKGPNYTGEKCTYMMEKHRGDGAQIVTHAQLAGILDDEETAKPAILIIDEATSVEHGHEKINLEQILKAWNTGDIDLSPELFNALRILLAESEKLHPKTNRPITISGLDICRNLVSLKDDRPKVKGTWKAAQSALDNLLEDGVPKTHDILSKLVNVPNWRALLGLAHVEKHGWAGTNIHNGLLSVPWSSPLQTGAIACVVRTDATSTENVHLALGGTQGEYNRVYVKKPEHFEMVRVDESMSKSSGKNGKYSGRKLQTWDAGHIENDGPNTLHIVNKSSLEEGHQLYERIKSLEGPVIYYGGDEARGSNRYKHVTHVVADSWHVPKRAIEELAYRLAYLAEINGMEGWESVDWHQEATFQMLPAEIIQTIQRARLVQASENRAVVVTLLDNRPLEEASPLFRDCVVARPCWYTWMHTGKIIHGGRWTAEHLLSRLLETSSGVLCPSLFFKDPYAPLHTRNPKNTTDDAETIRGNTMGFDGDNDGSISPAQDDVRCWKTSGSASMHGSVVWNDSSKIGAENRRGQPNRFSPYIDLGDFSICLTNADYDEIRRVMAGEWESRYGFWSKSSLSSGRGQYALLHTRDVTRDDIRDVVQTAGVGWKVATCQGVRVRMDNWGERVVEVSKGLYHGLQRVTRAAFASALAHALGESVSTLKRNAKAVGLTLADLQSLVPNPPPPQPPPPKPPTSGECVWSRPSISAPHVQRIEQDSQSWDIITLRGKAQMMSNRLHRSRGSGRTIIADELWTVVMIGKLHAGEDILQAMDNAESFVREVLQASRRAA